MIAGDIRRFLEETRSDKTYPLLWVEYPNFYIDKQPAGGLWYKASGGFVVLKNEEVGNHEAADQNWRDTEIIACDLVMKLDQIARQHGFEFKLNDVPMEPVNPLTVANDFGWRIGFQIKRLVGSCIDESKWS